MGLLKVEVEVESCESAKRILGLSAESAVALAVTASKSARISRKG